MTNRDIIKSIFAAVAMLATSGARAGGATPMLPIYCISFDANGGKVGVEDKYVSQGDGYGACRCCAAKREKERRREMKAEGKTMKAINWRKIRRHSGDFDIIFSRSEVEYCN